jgi:hypothetical protein
MGQNILHNLLIIYVQIPNISFEILESKVGGFDLT